MYKVSEDKGSSRRFRRSAFPYEDKNYRYENTSYSNDVKENDYEYNDEYYAPSEDEYYNPTKKFNLKSRNHWPHAAINWRQMGNKIDRQFQLLGGLGGLFSGFTSTGGPIVVNP